MNFKKIGLSVAVVGGIFSIGAVNAATVPGGQVNFVGQVVDTACGVSPDSSNLNVPMGSVPLSAILDGAGPAAISGTEINKTDFSLELVNCSTATMTTVSVAFVGESDALNTGLFEVGKNVAGAAQGIGLEIKTGSGEVVVPGVPTTTPFALNEGTTLLPFTAAYSGNAAPTAAAGDASVTLDFQLTYQ